MDKFNEDEVRQYLNDLNCPTMGGTVSARDLCKAMGKTWQHFAGRPSDGHNPVQNRAVKLISDAGYNVEDHVTPTTRVVDIGSGAKRSTIDYTLSLRAVSVIKQILEIQTSRRDFEYVYVLRHPKYPGEYKVGIAVDPKRRLSQYQDGAPDRDYDMAYTNKTPKCREIEKYMHDKYPNKNEWIRGPLKQIIEDIKNYKST